MNHFASPSFWSAYDGLPLTTQKLADKNYEILKFNPKHPSLHFKNIGIYWSVRVGIEYRALAVEVDSACFGFGLEITTILKVSFVLK